eukprot:160634_1
MELPLLHHTEREIMQKTIKCIHFYIAICGIEAFFYASRYTVWIEYAKTFDDYSLELATWIIYCDQILKCLTGLFMGYFGDRIGFDKAFCINLFILCLGCTIEALATNVKLLCTGFILCRCSLMWIGLAFIAWLLPNKYAKNKISMVALVTAVGLFTGPAFAGILFECFGTHRVTFIVNAVVSIMVWVLSLFYYGIQSKLETLQIALYSQIMPNDDVNELYPSFIKHTKALQQTEQIESSSWKSFFAAYSMADWCQKSILILECAMTGAFVNLLITFYLPLMTERYKDVGSVTLLCSLQIVCAAVSSAPGIVLAPKLYGVIDSHLLFITCCIICGCSMVPFLWHLPFHFYWISMALYGLAQGSLSIIVEHHLLDSFLPQHSGKINGIKCVSKGITAAFGMLLAGLYLPVTSVLIYGCIVCIVLHCLYIILRKTSKDAYFLNLNLVE